MRSYDRLFCVKLRALPIILLGLLKTIFRSYDILFCVFIATDFGICETILPVRCFKLIDSRKQEGLQTYLLGRHGIKGV